MMLILDLIRITSFLLYARLTCSIWAELTKLLNLKEGISRKSAGRRGRQKVAGEQAQTYGWPKKHRQGCDFIYSIIIYPSGNTNWAPIYVRWYATCFFKCISSLKTLFFTPSSLFHAAPVFSLFQGLRAILFAISLPVLTLSQIPPPSKAIYSFN